MTSPEQFALDISSRGAAAQRRTRANLPPIPATAQVSLAFATVGGEVPHEILVGVAQGAGYSEREAEQVKQEIDEYLKLREIIRRASDEIIDLKAYEADMRHLIDTYIEADASKVISKFDDVPLLKLIMNSGIADAINSLPAGIRKHKGAVAETIANNVRRKVVKGHLHDSAYYAKMSVLLDEIIADLKAKRLDYEAYLTKIAGLAKRVQIGHAESMLASLDTPGQRALYNNLHDNEKLALEVD